MTPARPRFRGRALVPPLLALAAVVALFELTPLDLLVQDRLYDADRRAWRIDGNEPIGRLIAYDGPKAALIALGLASLVLAAGPARFRDRLGVRRRGVVVGLLTLASVPLVVGFGKATTNVFCPSEIRRYGGDVPYIRAFEPYRADDRPARRGHGFPAGHASGGFALLGFVGARATRRWRRGAVATALLVGSWMGGYQMLKGAHYLSHTLVTLALAWLIATTWRLAVDPPEAPA